MSTLSFASRCSLLSLLTLLGGASGCTLGLRASGGCPAGEVCSDLTPDGLLFSGELVRGGSDPFVPVAARGTRHVAFGALGAAELPDYEVLTADGAIAGVTDALDGRARIEGRAAGRTLLRVVSSEDGGLLDAVPVRVEEIATCRVHPRLLVLLPRTGDDRRLGVLPGDRDPHDAAPRSRGRDAARR
jgi:hypothetical protein